LVVGDGKACGAAPSRAAAAPGGRMTDRDLELLRTAAADAATTRHEHGDRANRVDGCAACAAGFEFHMRVRPEWVVELVDQARAARAERQALHPKEAS